MSNELDSLAPIRKSPWRASDWGFFDELLRVKAATPAATATIDVGLSGRLGGTTGLTTCPWGRGGLDSRLALLRTRTCHGTILKYSSARIHLLKVERALGSCLQSRHWPRLGN